MKFFSKAPDGGKGSGVTGYFLVEIKSLFSIVLLHFASGSREAYHEHAFNALTIWLKGRVIELILSPVVRQQPDTHSISTAITWTAGDIKYTPRECFHKIEALEETWALSFRGPWVNTWRESIRGKLRTLTHGRKVVEG